MSWLVMDAKKPGPHQEVCVIYPIMFKTNHHILLSVSDSYIYIYIEFLLFIQIDLISRWVKYSITTFYDARIPFKGSMNFADLFVSFAGGLGLETRTLELRYRELHTLMLLGWAFSVTGLNETN